MVKLHFGEVSHSDICILIYASPFLRFMYFSENYITVVIANPGSGSPGAPIRGWGWGRGIVLPKNPGPGDFCFQNPGVFGGFFKRFLSEKWEIRGKIFTFSTKKLLENSNLT